MARPLSPRVRFLGLGQAGISVDPEVEDEIAMCKLWFLKMRLSKNHRVNTGFSTSPC
jgi:hypothetical protein